MDVRYLFSQFLPFKISDPDGASKPSETSTALPSCKIAVAGIFIALCYFYERYKKGVKPPQDYSELSIPKFYEMQHHELIARRIEEYATLKESLRPDDSIDDKWMSNTTEENKAVLRRFLLAKMVSILPVYNSIHSQQRGFAKLFTKDFITKTYWESYQASLSFLVTNLNGISDDIVSIDPGVDPSAVFQEAHMVAQSAGIYWDPNDPIPSQGPRPNTETESEKVERMLGPFGNIRLDGWTWRQQRPPAEEVEIQIRVPTGTTPSQVRVKLSVNAVSVTCDDKCIFDKTLLEKIHPDESTWNIIEEPRCLGDIVKLHGLSKYNGHQGTLNQRTPDMKAKGRWGVDLGDGVGLSIKDENLTTISEKGRVVITIEKVMSQPWIHPPWK